VIAESRIRELLHQADADAAAPPALGRDLVARVLQRELRIWDRIGLATSAAAAVFLVIGVTILYRAGAPAGLVGAQSADIAQLEREADSRASVARRIEELRRRDKRLAALRAQIARPDPVQQAQKELDQTALTLLQQGDHLYRDLDLAQPAADSYRAAVRLFPQTRWAAMARQRLADMRPEKGDPS
jgi:hypothetical protein